MSTFEALTVLAVGATALSLPFGAWRVTVRRFSWRWFLAIHLPIPFVFVLRTALDLSAWYIPVSLGCALAGQLLGSWLYMRIRARRRVVEAEAAE
jgi:hypothetical protein